MMKKLPMPMPGRTPPKLPSPRPIERPEAKPPKLKAGPAEDMTDRFSKIKKMVGRY